jgi:hypothetical protein
MQHFAYYLPPMKGKSSQEKENQNTALFPPLLQSFVIKMNWIF